MVVSALPPLLKGGGEALSIFLVSYFMLALGTGEFNFSAVEAFANLLKGLFKPNIAPAIVDQYRYQRPYIKVLKSGKKVIVDPETTIQRIMLLFYGLVNVGSFFAVATTYAEKRVGYWLAFLVPGITYFFIPLLLIIMRNHLIKMPPDPTEFQKVFKIILVATRRNKARFWRTGFWESAKPSFLARQGIDTFNGQRINWDDKLVQDVQRTVSVCQVFVFFVLYNLNDGGVGSVSASQGSTMTTDGVPNDLLSNLNPLTVVIAIPILSSVVYPLLNRYGIKFGRISRITFGFTLAWISGIIGAIVQWRVYETSPCGYRATGCTVGDGVSPLSIWLQVPNIALGGLSECFCYVTAYELAYARSPKNMKGFVTALFLFSNAVSSALGLAITPAIADPYLIWIWAGPAIALFIQTCLFYWKYRHMDDDDFMSWGEEESSVLQELAGTTVTEKGIQGR
jgi:dipeptide/tripeptide permease